MAVPLGAPFSKAVEFVHMKKPWIHKHLTEIKRRETESRALADLSATIDKTKAKRQLAGRLNRLAKYHGFTFNGVSIRSQKTRWGSCSRSNNISLNAKLVLLPEDLVDYVILHELVHTRIRNHGKDFWAEMDRHIGSSKALASKLRKYGYSLP